MDLAVQDVLGQTVIGNAVAQHAAQARLAVVQGDAVAQQRQIGSHGQARRAAADDGHLGIELHGGRLGGRTQLRVGVDVIGDEALQIADRDGLVDFAAVAIVLAGMLAHAPAGRRERAALADQLIGLFEFAGRHQSHVPLGVDARRAGGLARRGPGRFGNAEDVGNGLRVGTEDGFAQAQAAVEFAAQVHRAGRCAVAAGVALVQIHIAGILADLDLEIAGLARYSLDVRQSDDLDVLIPGALHQLGREDAHGAVAGGKGLIELGHPPADGGRRIEQIDLETALGEVERGLDAGNARPADQHGADGFGRGGISLPACQPGGISLPACQRLRLMPIVRDHSHASASDSLGLEQCLGFHHQAVQR